jgi:D-alanyl-lipoteichoic acid acyltransferase DltB (MBOAT superfamily)
MLFNSGVFLFAFLPLALAAYFALGRFAGFRAACVALVVASLIYYAWWDPRFLLVLVPATLTNAALGYALCRGSGETKSRKLLLWAGLAGNLALLGYFKYAGFLVANLNAALGTHLGVAAGALPLGISFFIFQKIAFLVDAYHGRVRHFRLLNFFLFVMFFPQLIAGPIVHHREVMPQFDRPEVARFDAMNFAIGLTVFAIGLFKKMVIADGCALIADPVFDAFAKGQGVDAARAWAGALAYAFQLYFDFSGYSDMAVGLARMFNVDLPVNFNSPYKAASIIDFWRRWHMTLSRFLRDYLYIPLGGNRKGPARRYVNLMITMLLGGLWHGANWAFVLWGGAHGLMLIVNHAWLALKRALGGTGPGNPATRLVARSVTFLAVVTAWVPFRMVNLEGAGRMLRQMYLSPDLAIRMGDFIAAQAAEIGKLRHILAVTLRLEAPAGFYKLEALDLAGPWLLAAALVAFTFPNVYQLFERQAVARPAHSEPPAADPTRWRWSLSARWALATSLLTATALMQLGKITPFLYFQF